MTTNLLPYEPVIHILFRVTDALIITVCVFTVLIQRQIGFARRRANDPDWNRWTVYPALLTLHRRMFPASSLRKAALTSGALLIANLFLTQNLIHRDQAHLDLYRASLIQQSHPGHP